MPFDVTQIKSIGNAYLLKGEHIALVDAMASVGFRKLKKALSREGVSVGDIEFILITHYHYDHVGNAKRIKEISGARVIASVEDAPYIEGKKEMPPVSRLSMAGRIMSKLPRRLIDAYQSYTPVEVDRTVKDGDVIEELGLEVVAMPGHTPGGLAYLDREGRRAFTGDMVSYFFSRPGMPALLASENIEQIFASQDRLAALDLDIAYTGHGGVIGSNASSVIAEMSRAKKAKLL